MRVGWGGGKTGGRGTEAAVGVSHGGFWVIYPNWQSLSVSALEQFYGFVILREANCKSATQS